MRLQTIPRLNPKFPKATHSESSRLHGWFFQINPQSQPPFHLDGDSTHATGPFQMESRALQAPLSCAGRLSRNHNLVGMDTIYRGMFVLSAFSYGKCTSRSRLVYNIQLEQAFELKQPKPLTWPWVNNLCLHFGADEHPGNTYFDVHQGYRVLTHSHMSALQPDPFERRFPPCHGMHRAPRNSWSTALGSRRSRPSRRRAAFFFFFVCWKKKKWLWLSKK